MTSQAAPKRGQASSAYHQDGPLFAALDLGTNNCRLMIARPERQRLKIVDSFSQIVRLGEGASASGRLSDAAMERTLAALRVCAEKLGRYTITESHFVATAACRDAANGKEFVERIKQETGIQLTIISEKDEAVLAFLGCSPLLDSETDYGLMLDIGGGSTELMLVDMQNPISPKIIGWQSFPLGVMSVAENEGAGHLSPIDYHRLVLRLAENFSDFAQQYNLAAVVSQYHLQMICCSGTVTTVGALAKQLPKYDRREVDGMKMPLAQVYQVIEQALAMTPEQRAANPCIGVERSEFLMAGCAILQAACRVVPVEKITVADRGVREGILLSLFQKNFR